MESFLDKSTRLDNDKFKEENVLQFRFDLGIIELLGSQLYTKLPSIMVEFISNSYDADATSVDVIIDEDDLGPRKITNIIIEDNGIGISDIGIDNIEEINEKFLKIGRKRRKDENSSVSKIYKRKLQGKKGIGKLAGFGITNKMEITTTSNGITNKFILDFEEMKNCSGEVYLPQHILRNQKLDFKDGTIIKLIDIKRKGAININELAESIVKRIQIFDNTFSLNLKYKVNNMTANEIELNNDMYMNYIKSKNKLQFSWNIPENLNDLDLDNDIIDFFKSNCINGEIFTTETPLKKDDQGIILYANGKLCQENYSFNERANDNFYSYLMGKLNIDYIDSDIYTDNISTARDSLVWENEIAQELEEKIDLVIKKIQNMWRKKRRDNKEKIINEKLNTNIDKWIDSLNPYEKKSAKKIIDVILKDENMSSDRTTEFIEYIQDMYSFDSFKSFASDLIETEELDSIKILEFIKKWNIIEATEMAKVATGRIKTIEQFEEMIKNNLSETKAIQPFLEEFPWILDPRIITFKREATFATMLKENFPDSELEESNRRIDFICHKANDDIIILELKRPEITITEKYIDQIYAYQAFAKKTYPNNNIKTYLVSNNYKTNDKIRLMIETACKSDIFGIKSYSEMVTDAKQYHYDLIEKYEKLKIEKSS